MTWSERVKEFQIGDSVCYSRTYLQSTGQFTGDVPFARGVVQCLVPLGQITLAEIAWDTEGLPDRVNIANLSRITNKGIDELP